MISRITRRFTESQSPEPIGQTKLKLLREAELFRDLSQADMQEIERVTTVTTSKRGRISRGGPFRRFSGLYLRFRAREFS